MTDVVFIHGAWVGPRCWDGWKRAYEAEGVRCVAPAWPFDDRPYDELRRAPDPALATVKRSSRPMPTELAGWPTRSRMPRSSGGHAES